MRDVLRLLGRPRVRLWFAVGTALTGVLSLADGRPYWGALCLAVGVFNVWCAWPDVRREELW